LQEYIHRVGRTARAGKSGRALLFLLPEELNYLKYLRQAKVQVKEFDFPKNKISNIQSSVDSSTLSLFSLLILLFGFFQLEVLLEKNYYLHTAARDAYRAYLQAYASHHLKDCYDVHKLDLVKVAKSFGFSAPPKVDLSIL
jgi:ATP-dependent RNA helicase DDX18/HAS1